MAAVENMGQNNIDHMKKCTCKQTFIEVNTIQAFPKPLLLCGINIILMKFNLCTNKSYFLGKTQFLLFL